MSPYKSESGRRKKNVVMLCKGRMWQKNEQDEGEHGTGEEEGSQHTAADSCQPLTSDGGGGNVSAPESPLIRHFT